MKRITSILLLLLASVVIADEKTPGRGHIPPSPEVRKRLHEQATRKHGQRQAMLAKFQTLPASFDCRTKGWVIPVGDQGNCGSCYLYSTVYGTLTSAFVKAGYGKADGSFVMSVQYGMDCHNFGGCNGGNGTEVIDWIMTNGWPAESWVDIAGKVYRDYPSYSASSQSCRKVAGAKYWKPADWGFATGDQSNRPATTLEIKTALYNYGPLNVALDAGGQFSNGTGTITSLGSSIDHEIELVAWDDAKDGGAFLLKNQWSKDWGVGGYRWITYSAAQRLVDVFWVSVAALPPPPGPPVPPVPPPGDGDYITVTTYVNGVTSTKTYFINGAPSGKTVPDATPQELIDALRKIYGPVTVPATSPVKPVQTPEPPLIEKKVFPPLPIKLDLDAMYPATTQANKDSLRKLLEDYDVMKIDREVKITPRATTTPVIRNHPSTADLLLLEVRRLQEQLESNQRFIRETLKP